MNPQLTGQAQTAVAAMRGKAQAPPLHTGRWAHGAGRRLDPHRTGPARPQTAAVGEPCAAVVRGDPRAEQHRAQPLTRFALDDPALE